MAAYWLLYAIPTLLVLLTHPAKAIIGGTTPPDNKSPFAVSIHKHTTAQSPSHPIDQQSQTYLCTGALISRRTVLTSAACVADARDSNLTVRVGSLRSDSGGILNNVEQVIVHPEFNRTTFDADFALLHFAAGAGVPLSIPHVNIARTSHVIAYQKVTTYGFGVTTNTTTTTSPNTQLQRLPVFLMARYECRRAWYDGHSITNRMLCDESRRGTGACEGDLGAPVVDEEKGVVVGLRSWTGFCENPGRPEVNGDVGSVGEWVEANRT